jgi:hypothetical protein
LPRYEDDQLPSPPSLPFSKASHQPSHQASLMRRDESIDDDSLPLVQWPLECSDAPVTQIQASRMDSNADGHPLHPGLETEEPVHVQVNLDTTLNPGAND